MVPDWNRLGVRPKCAPTVRDPPYLQHAAHQILEQWLGRFDEFHRAPLELAAADLADFDAERLERAAHLVLDVDELALEQAPVRQ